jgi:hypothetical protein
MTIDANIAAVQLRLLIACLRSLASHRALKRQHDRRAPGDFFTMSAPDNLPGAQRRRALDLSLTSRSDSAILPRKLLARVAL